MMTSMLFRTKTSFSTLQRGLSTAIEKSQIGKQEIIETIFPEGRGGRSSDAGFTSTVFGSTGFVGRYLVNRLGKQGIQTVVPYRGDELCYRHLKVMGDLGQIVPLHFHLRDYDSIFNSVKDSKVVFNLVGSDQPTKNFTLEQCHVEGARMIGKACKEAKVLRLIHVSALGADHNSPSEFLRAKAAGEEAIRKEFPQVTIVRPSSIYGVEDRFLNRIAYMCRTNLGSVMVKEGKQVVQPVHVVDVAQGLIEIMRRSETVGQDFEFIGPKSYTYEQLMKYFSDITYRPIRPINLPLPILKAYFSIINYLPFGHTVGTDEAIRMTLDQKSEGKKTLESLGIQKTPLENVILQNWRMYRSPIYYNEPLPEAQQQR